MKAYVLINIRTGEIKDVVRQMRKNRASARSEYDFWPVRRGSDC